MNEEAKHVIGAVDIGGTKIAVGMVDDDGKVLASQECSTDADLGYLHALGNITEMLRTTARTANTTISGIGIGSTRPRVPAHGRDWQCQFLSAMGRPEPGQGLD